MRAFHPSKKCTRGNITSRTTHLLVPFQRVEVSALTHPVVSFRVRVDNNDDSDDGDDEDRNGSRG